MRRAARVAFWLVLGYVAFVTLSPIAFRPVTPFGADAERFMAFFLASLLLLLAYPTRWVLWVAALLLAGGLLETSQNLMPGRHGRLADFEVKAFGILCGSALGLVLDLLTRDAPRPLAPATPPHSDARRSIRRNGKPDV